ncbi:transposase IS3/IS911 family protein [Burkholderia lata]|nr:transposase IS3/IS911 family protein [Burkholderia lata]
MLTIRGEATKAGKLKDVVDRQRKPLTEVEAELAQVKRWLVEVRTERALLKRFATYFAKESR